MKDDKTYSNSNDGNKDQVSCCPGSFRETEIQIGKVRLILHFVKLEIFSILILIICIILILRTQIAELSTVIEIINMLNLNCAVSPSIVLCAWTWSFCGFRADEHGVYYPLHLQLWPWLPTVHPIWHLDH